MDDRLMSQQPSVLISRRGAVECILAGSLATGMSLLGQSVQADETLVAAAVKSGEAAGVLMPALRQAREIQTSLKKVKDYTATFYKDEQVGKNRVTQKMSIKLREAPLSVYLRFQKDIDGREVLFVEGKNDGKALIHGSGLEALVGTLKLAPDNKRVMDENRYPLNMIGLTNMINKLVKQWETDLDSTDITVKLFPNAKVATVECKVFESTRAKKSVEGQFHITRLYVDKATSLPVRVEQFDFPAKAGDQPVILEQYTYLDLKTNVGLTDADFDPKNKSYKF